MWMIGANFRRTHSPSRLAWSESWRPSYIHHDDSTINIVMAIIIIYYYKKASIEVAPTVFILRLA